MKHQMDFPFCGEQFPAFLVIDIRGTREEREVLGICIESLGV